MTNLQYGYIVLAFNITYAIMYSVGGWFIDTVGARRGFSIIVIVWSIVSMLHAAAGSIFHLYVFRFLLGVGEGGNYPASAKVTSAWFPPNERSTAVGIYNMGSSMGAIVAPPLVAFITYYWGWRQAFIITGFSGFIWLILWWLLFYDPKNHNQLNDDERDYILKQQVDGGQAQQKVPIRKLFKFSEVWALVGARFLTEQVWIFYVAWLPKYLREARGFSLFEVGVTAWIPFLAGGLGGVFAGWISKFPIQRGYDPVKVRKMIMLILACLMTVSAIAGITSSSVLCITMVCIACAAHNGFTVHCVTLIMDTFPTKVIGTITGFSGTGGAIGVLIASPIIGAIVDKTGSYLSIFMVYSFLHIVATGWVYLMLKKKRYEEV